MTVLALVGERGREVREFLKTRWAKRGCAVGGGGVHFGSIAAAAHSRGTGGHRGGGIFLQPGQSTFCWWSIRSRALPWRSAKSDWRPASRRRRKATRLRCLSLLARLVERAGHFGAGSITAFYTVLMEGDDQQDPLVDAVRALLDGHIVLDRRLAAQKHFPPIAVFSIV